MVTSSSVRRDLVFRAIADPTRREILKQLRGRRITVGELAANFSQSRPAISRHLRLLRAAGLVVTHERGASRLCELNPKPLQSVNDWLREYETFWSGSLRRLKHHAEENR